MKVLLVLVFFTSFTQAAASTQSSSSLQTGLDLSINFPHLDELTYERLSKEHHWSWGIGVGFVPTVTFPSGSSRVGISMQDVNFRGRWHPFAGGFFLGLGIGFQNVKGVGDQNIDVSGTPVPTEVTVGIANLFLTPHFGWIWTFGDFIFGAEGGFQFGFGGASKLSLAITDPSLQSYLGTVQTTAQYQKFQNEVQDGFSKLGNLAIYYAAVRLGWTF